MVFGQKANLLNTGCLRFATLVVDWSYKANKQWMFIHSSVTEPKPQTLIFGFLGISNRLACALLECMLDKTDKGHNSRWPLLLFLAMVCYALNLDMKLRNSRGRHFSSITLLRALPFCRISVCICWCDAVSGVGITFVDWGRVVTIFF